MPQVLCVGGLGQQGVEDFHSRGQVVDGLQQRRDIERHRLAVGQACHARQRQHRQDIVGALGHADDEQPHRWIPEALPPCPNGFENTQRLASTLRAIGIAGGFRGLAGGQVPGQARGAFFRRALHPALVVQQLAHHLAMQQRILADIEGGEVKAEGLRAHGQPPHSEQPGVFTAVVRQAIRHQGEVPAPVVGGAVGALCIVGGCRKPECRHLQQAPIGHVPMSLGELLQHGREPIQVLRQALVQFRAEGRLAAGLAQVTAEAPHLGQVAADDGPPLCGQGLKDGGGRDVRVAIHVAADP